MLTMLNQHVILFVIVIKFKGEAGDGVYQPEARSLYCFHHLHHRPSWLSW